MMIGENRYLSITPAPGATIFEAVSDSLVDFTIAPVSISGTGNAMLYYYEGNSGLSVPLTPGEITLDPTNALFSGRNVSMKAGSRIQGYASVNGTLLVSIRGAILGGFGGLSPVNTYVPPAGYVTWWQFDAMDSGIVPDVAGNNNLLLQGNGSITGGLFGSTVSLDGPPAGNWLSLYSPLAGFPWPETLVSGFLKYDPVSGVYGMFAMGVSNDWTDSTRRMWVYTSSVGLTVYFGRCDAANSIIETYALTPTAGKTWIHFAVRPVLSSGVTKIQTYIDGVDQGESTLSMDLRTGLEIAFIGARATSSSPELLNCDEVLLYDRLLTANEIQQLAVQP